MFTGKGPVFDERIRPRAGGCELLLTSMPVPGRGGAAVTACRAIAVPKWTAEGWVLDGEDLCGVPFSFTLPKDALPGIVFAELIGRGVDWVVYGGTHEGRSAAIKILASV
jgi:hypothetical protein